MSPGAELEPKTKVVLRQKCTVPVDMDVFVLGSHFHGRGTRFEINLLDPSGEPGELVYESTDWQSPPEEMCMMVGIYYPDAGFLRCDQ